MTKKLLGLSDDGRLVLKLPGGEVEPVPTSSQALAFLLIDCSSSMRGSKLSEAKEGASTFARDARKKHYSVGLIRFATTTELLCGLEEQDSILESAISTLNAKGSTDMAGAIRMATRELSAQSGMRAIVIATDGKPNCKVTALETARKAKDFGIDIIAIGTGDADLVFLAELASRSDLAIKVRPLELRNAISGAVKLLPSVRPER